MFFKMVLYSNCRVVGELVGDYERTIKDSLERGEAKSVRGKIALHFIKFRTIMDEYCILGPHFELPKTARVNALYWWVCLELESFLSNPPENHEDLGKRLTQLNLDISQLDFILDGDKDYGDGKKKIRSYC